MDKEKEDGQRKAEGQSTEKSVGILRLNSAPRSRSRATSPLSLTNQVEPTSPQPSVDRVSVTFAVADDEDEKQRASVGKAKLREKTVDHPDVGDMQRISIAEEEGDEDDYSASACAIMQRRSSSRRQSRRKRRPSSPFSTEAEATLRRRSSVYTISSGETAISIEESGSQEQIFEKLKLHKEVLSGVKQQPWPLRRKIKLVRQAKSYVRRHEGVLQERLAHTRSTKDAIARVSLFTTKKWQYCRRELVNLQTWLIPWELRIKEIESHFGSAVASYFTFLRWLFWINLVMCTIITAFVAIPEVLTADPATAGERKIMLREEKIKSKHLLTLWEFEGILKYSPFFYGWYTNQDSKSGYRLPLAYFVTNLVIYIYSFVAILRKMAENSRLSKLTEKEDECVFSWKLFTGWDFMIGNPETADNRMASIVLGFKEALLEEAEREKDERNWKIISMRIFVNTSVMSLLALSAYVVVKMVARSAEELEHPDWWRQNEITVVMTLITYVFPIFFEILGFLESYHPRKQLRVQLARIMVLNLLNLYSLIFALFGKINPMMQDLGDLQSTVTNCSYKQIECGNEMTKSRQIATLASLSLILAGNVTSLQYKNEATLPSDSMLPKDFYLNPILDAKSLEEIYNVGDYPPLDYENYDIDDSKTNGLNGTSSSSTETIFQDGNFTSEIYERNDTLELTSATIEDNFTSAYSTDLFDEVNTTFSIHFNESSTTLYDEATNSTFNTSDVNTANDEFSTNSSSEDTARFATETEPTDASSTTAEASTESQITTMFTERSSEHTTDGETAIFDFTDDPTNKGVIPLAENNCVKCFEKICKTTTQDTIASPKVLDLKTRKKLRRLCWETMFGQELAKLTVMDLVLTIVSTLSVDFFRAVFVRFMNSFWCWDLEKQFPQYGDFKIAENILHLVNNQGMIWMGMFFSPGLTALNLLKLGILMYLRSWAVLTCNVPHEVIFRASRSNNFYFALLLTMLFLCVLPVGYAIVWVEPSWHCGPFSGYKKMYHLATKHLTNSLPEPIQRCLDYIASPGIVIPLIVLMTLIIYYMVSLTGSLREANDDLKIQLRHERTEERRKLFKIVKKREDLADASFLKWRKMLPALSKQPTRVKTQKGEPEVAVPIENSIEMHTRNRSSSEVAELTDVEEDVLPHDHVFAHTLESSYREKGAISSRAGTTRTLHDSWESQSSECAVIPEIRINEAEGKSESCRPIPVENRDPSDAK
ncbi:transmembrane channel-like protein [Halictus rubicundus]|uniref:transmembrane channel-like protein n=1 Tax=Halictus rubicundus TaxID=77578 RepID=UPI004036D9D9